MQIQGHAALVTGAAPASARAASHIVTNAHLNGEVILLDGALRMAPR